MSRIEPVGRQEVLVTAEVPLVMSLGDLAATAAAVGGKGASLAYLVRAGFPVPLGFHVTVGAYRDFVGRCGLHEPVLAALSGVDSSDPATFEAASRRIGELFAGQPVPVSTAAAIARAYADLGEEVAVAVRSSATAEDLPCVSSAGQHDTYLNVRGRAGLLDAVQRCWASLWTPRAIGYYARHGIAAGEASMAVVVQRFVPADAAGVLFTVNPVGGGRDQVLVNASWGLGEAVVSGHVIPDTVVVGRADGRVADYQIGGKEVMTVADDTGTRERDTPADRRQAAVLSDDEAGELARLGLAIEELYGRPADAEWARADGQLFVLQARPATSPKPAGQPGDQAAQPGIPPGEEWNDSLNGDYLWTNGNLGEAIPDVMTPVTWSFIELFMTRAISPPHLPGYRGYGRVGGRFYVNFSMSVALAAVGGIARKRFIKLTEPVFGRLPPGEEVPRVRLPRWKIFRMLAVRTIANARRVRRCQKGMREFVASAPARCADLRAGIQRIGEAAALADAGPSRVEPLFVEAADMLVAAGGGTDALVLLLVPRKLAKLIGQDDATVLLSGQRAGAAELASLGPMIGLAQLARGEIDRATFALRYGHRGPHEAEVSVPRPAEDPGWIDAELARLRDTAHSADHLLVRQEAARQAVWDRLRQQQPKRAAKVRAMADRWAEVARAREETRSELVRSLSVLRTWVLRAGELTGRGDDLFFLSYQEILDVLRGDKSALSSVPARRATYSTYRALPPYPAVIRGRFDPVRWSADPDRRTDYYNEHTTTAPPSPAGGTIAGFPGVSGVVEGIARVIGQPDDDAQLGDGEILVTTTTNIGWTPVFPRAAAVVTDVGAPLSHAAIVARELGIPAVVGCGDATMLLHSGDRIRVDGGKGTVELLLRA